MKFVWSGLFLAKMVLLYKRISKNFRQLVGWCQKTTKDSVRISGGDGLDKGWEIRCGTGSRAVRDGSDDSEWNLVFMANLSDCRTFHFDADRLFKS